MKCSQCWADNDEGSKKCVSCGHRLHKVQLSPASGNDGIADFFAFRKLVTPSLIKGSYKAGTFLITLVSIIAVISPHLIERAGYQKPDNAKVIIGALLFFIIANLIWRIVCESAILVFSLHEVLVSIDDKAKAVVTDRFEL